MQAPASSPTSSTSRPSAEARIPHHPPPPRNATASVKGRSRLQNPKPTVTALPRKGTCTSRVKGQVRDAEHAERDVGQRQAEPCLQSFRRHAHFRRVRKTVERDQALQVLDEAQDALEPDVVDDDVQLGLGVASGREREAREIQREQFLAREQMQGEVTQLGEHVRFAAAIEARHHLHAQREAVLAYPEQRLVLVRP